MKKIGIALGGGGAKGMAHLGFLQRLDENDIKPCIISGTSIGAVIGALYCSGMKAKDIFDLFKNLDEKTSTGKKRRVFIKFKAAKQTNRTELLKKFLEYILPVKTFEELKIPLKICAVDFHTLKEVMFDSGSLVDAILASIALPNVILPYEIDGKYYIDGGCVNVLPADYIRKECDVLLGIDVSSLNQDFSNNKPTTRNSYLAFESATRKACFDYKLIDSKVDLLYKLVFDRISTLDFNKYRQAYEVGLDYSEDLIKKINKLL